MFYQGEPGAFSESAVHHYFPGEEARGLPSFAEVFQRLVSDSHAYALLPIENAYRGTVTEVWDRLVEQDALTIWAEVVQPVHLALMAPAETTLDSVRIVRSHPQALMQSRGFWGPRGYSAEPTLDTAGSARALAESPESGVAAVASPDAAARYGLRILAEPIEDYADNRTRFWLIAQRKPPCLPEGNRTGQKVTIAFDIPHRPGSLAAVLSVFAEHSLDLTKIESRPRPGYPFEFRFWVDAALRGPDPADAFDALHRLKEAVLFHRFLGFYPAFAS
ncbi:prephenate dehydratase domain-containing protein [Sulfobacillus harzensis]|uniref:Prephenate dehydratase n=1 Tax=Sulfobacillus harzensis TaxID=2729629 RepID=A0A7Y0L556_9FIRM|nr:prephenate dehydratase [Sulfobacillus harzensis]